MMPPALAAVLTAACDTMSTLAIFPLRFEADSQAARILTVMNDNVLGLRSVGPYSRDNLPPEGLDLADFVSLRWRTRHEHVDINLEIDGRWPRATVFLPQRGVEVLYLVPEEAPPGYQPPPGDLTATIDVKLALELVARSVEATGADLPIKVTVSYPPDPDAQRQKASLPNEFAHAVLPVIPTVELDRRGCSASQRAAHDRALRLVAYSDQEFQALGRTGFSTRVGSARIQDSH